jgi:ribonuclease J
MELAFDGHRLLLDAGEPLDADDSTVPERMVPATLDTVGGVDALVVSHPHQDHWGLLQQLPQRWPVWCGQAAGILMDMTARVGRRRLSCELHTFRSGEQFTLGPFTITPYLTDHSAFDAHMLLIDCAGKRILYSGDFRRTGRKRILVERMMAAPPKDVDVLLLEGTTLGRDGPVQTEQELQEAFESLFRNTEGRVFVSWSAQNIDRTVSIYKACKRARRLLVLDIYTLDVLERLSDLGYRLPRLGFRLVRPVITSGMKRLYGDPTRMDAPAVVERCATAKGAIGAAGLEKLRNSVVMLRPSLVRDFQAKGVVFNNHDAWVFSMWNGYLECRLPHLAAVKVAVPL